MSSIGEHTEASSTEAELGRVRDDERSSPRSEVVVASADTGNRPVSARASVMALLEYASVGWTDHDRESAQCCSAGQTEAIEQGDRDRLHYIWPIPTTDLEKVSRCTSTVLKNKINLPRKITL